MNTEVTVKHPEILLIMMEEIFHYKLIDITKFVIRKIMALNVTPVITSGFRRNDPGVHGHGRGIDFRSHELTPTEIALLCEAVNTKWQYDPKRPSMECLIHHDTGLGPHLHLQVHPNTKEV